MGFKMRLPSFADLKTKFRYWRKWLKKPELMELADWRDKTHEDREILDEIERYERVHGRRINTRHKVLIYFNMLYKFMKKHLRRFKGKTILDIGATQGIFLSFLQNRRGSKGISLGLDDVAMRIGKQVRKRKGLKDFPAIKGDARILPLKPESVDAVIADNFFVPGEVLDKGDIPLVLQELRRVLKPKGKVFAYSYVEPLLTRIIRKEDIELLGFRVIDKFEETLNGTIVVLEKI